MNAEHHFHAVFWSLWKDISLDMYLAIRNVSKTSRMLLDENVENIVWKEESSSHRLPARFVLGMKRIKTISPRYSVVLLAEQELQHLARSSLVLARIGFGCVLNGYKTQDQYKRQRLEKEGLSSSDIFLDCVTAFAEIFAQREEESYTWWFEDDEALRLSPGSVTAYDTFFLGDSPHFNAFVESLSNLNTKEYRGNISNLHHQVHPTTFAYSSHDKDATPFNPLLKSHRKRMQSHRKRRSKARFTAPARSG